MDKSLVNKATSADDQPTPGYMYNEIARITHASAEASKQLEEYLIKRLKKDNVHQKLKCLKVISACAKMGGLDPSIFATRGASRRAPPSARNRARSP